MAKSGLLSILTSWLKMVWSLAWCPGISGVGLKDCRKPVAFGLLLIISVYVCLELYLFVVVDSAPAGATLPISTNTSSSPCHLSPYCVINVKSLLLGPVEFYIHKPLSVMFNDAFHVDRFMTANFVSFLHILAALLSAKLISNDSLLVRRLGVLVYEVRDFLDCLDGVVAKEELKRRGEEHLFSQPAGAWGYFVDGVSDGLGSIFVLIGCLIYMQKHVGQRKVQQIVYAPLNVVSVSNPNSPLCSSKFCQHEKRDEDATRETAQHNPGFFSGLWSALCKCLAMFRITGVSLPAFFYLNQLLLSSMFWNRNIILYGKVLEPGRLAFLSGPIASYILRGASSKAIHSPLMWMIIFGWRIMNPLFLMDILMFFIFFDKMYEFLMLIQYSGFIAISALSVLSEVYRATLICVVGCPEPSETLSSN